MQPDDAELATISTIQLSIGAAGDKGAGGELTLRAADIDKLISRLALLRAAMRPAVPRTLSAHTDISRVSDPVWILHAAAAAEEKLLLLRHPGLGWMMFQLPPSEAARLGHGLLTADPPRRASERLPTGRMH